MTWELLRVSRSHLGGWVISGWIFSARLGAWMILESQHTLLFLRPLHLIFSNLIFVSGTLQTFNGVSDR